MMHVGCAFCGLRHQEMERGDCQGPTRQHGSLTLSQALSTKSQDHRAGAGGELATKAEIRDPEGQGPDPEARPARGNLGTKVHRARKPPSPLAPGDEGNGWADSAPRDKGLTLCWLLDHGANGIKVRGNGSD